MPAKAGIQWLQVLRDPRRSLPPQSLGGGGDDGWVLQQLKKFFIGESSLPQQCSQGTFCDFLMVRNGESSVGRVLLSQDDVTARLVINLVTNSRQRLAQLTAGKNR